MQTFARAGMGTRPDHAPRLRWSWDSSLPRRTENGTGRRQTSCIQYYFRISRMQVELNQFDVTGAE